jgi:carboxymethylenebutenolidase
MNTMIQITARDGHLLDAYLARPASKPRGGIVIAQEMYGITAYLRET